MSCPCLNQNIEVAQINPPTPCTYTLEQVIAWKDLLFCIKNNDLLLQANITVQQLNKLLGIVLSAIRNTNPCYLNKELNSIETLIIQISSLNIC